MVWLLIKLPSVQNKLVHYATEQASKRLKTEIKIGSVDFSPFNRFYLNQILVRDQSRDTLFYAGSIQLKITDWFFVKDKLTIHYFGLSDAYINTNRTDSTWNYQFIIDALTSPTPSNKQPSTVDLNLKEIKLQNIRYHTIDKWRGEDQLISLQSFSLTAEKFDLKQKKIDFNTILIQEPVLG